MKYQGPPPPPVTDKEDVYDGEISPLMTQVIAICKEHGIPMFATFVYAPGDFCTTHIPGPKDDDASKALLQCERAVTTGPAVIAMMIMTAAAPPPREGEG